MYRPNLKSVAFPVPEIIGVPKKFGQSLDTPTLPFLQNFSRAIIRIDTVIVLKCECVYSMLTLKC